MMNNVASMALITEVSSRANRRVVAGTEQGSAFRRTNG
jgi:hypothetical protein